MAKTQRPRQAQTKNSKEFLVWTVLLTLTLVVAGGILYSLREDEGHVHIPENAFEDVKPSAERYASDSAPNAVLMPRNISSGSSSESETQETRESIPVGDRSANLQKAMDLVDRGQWNEAEPLLLEEIQKDPKNVGALLEMAMIQILDKNDHRSAIPYLEEALHVDLTNDSARIELLNSYDETQDFARGMKEVSSWPDTDEFRGIKQAALGHLQASAGDSVSAIDNLKKAIDSGETSYQARSDLAEAYASQGRAGEANREYEQIINGSYRPEQQRQAKIELAKNYAAMRNYQAAYDLLEGLISNNPKDKYVARVLNEIQAQASR